MKSDVIDIEVHVHAKTDRAVLVSDDDDRTTAVWLPLSQIEFEAGRAGMATVTLPEWLAVDKGLV